MSKVKQFLYADKDMALSRHMPTMVPRHVAWRMQYRERRYARHLSQKELNARIRDILLNMLRLTNEAKVGLPPMTAESVALMEKWTHVLEEMVLRHGPYPAGFTREILHSEPFPDFVGELADKAARAFSKLGADRPKAIIKFGTRTHMTSLFERGSLRIQPASYFRNNNHLGAVRDDELELPMSFALSPEDIRGLVVNPEDLPAEVPEQRFDATFKFRSDYWLYCVTRAVEPRLFADFGADACVIISDVRQFSERLKGAAEEHLKLTMMEGPAVYVDPLLPKTANVFIPMSKHFRYEYQQEHRFCWIPEIPTLQLSAVDVSIGSLQGIAELITL